MLFRSSAEAVSFLTTEVIPGLDANDLRNEIEEMIRGEAA